jgi:(2R)-3-sulfolactate dehydrogenase (NADP+)
MRYPIESAREMARRAAVAAGASDAAAESLADATVAAERSGRGAVGFAHLPDYLDGFAAGRIAGKAQPEICFPASAIIRVDAGGGIAQLGFDLAFDELRARAGACGMAAFAQANSYTAGELGYYTRRLADAGLVALAASNGPALMTAGAGREPAYGTNPLSFAAPVEGGPPLVIDQASSATAFVNVRRAAERGEEIPEGWAVDRDGRPTTDAREAIKGLLLAFGGARGANIALMVEVLAAGLTGANWSLDAPSFAAGAESPGVGLFIVALKPDLLAPGFPGRLASQVERLAAGGIHIPGRNRPPGEIELSAPLVAAIERYAKP